MLTENFRGGLTGRARDSINNFSNTLYIFGEFSATDTSQNPTLCDAAKDAPSVSGIYINYKHKMKLETRALYGKWIANYDVKHVSSSVALQPSVVNNYSICFERNDER